MKITPLDAAEVLCRADNDLLDGWDEPHYVSFPDGIGHGSRDAGFTMSFTDAQTGAVTQFLVKVYAQEEEEEDGDEIVAS